MVLCFKRQIPLVHCWYESNSLLYINLVSCSLALLTFEAEALSWASLVAQLLKNHPAMWETWVLIPGLGRSAGEGKGYPLQYSGLEKSMDCIMGFPVGARNKEPSCQCWRCKRHRFDSCFGKTPWRRKWQPMPVCLSGESHGQRSLVGYIYPWDRKESDMTKSDLSLALIQGDPTSPS